jgi:hypothetical protein
LTEAQKAKLPLTCANLVYASQPSKLVTKQYLVLNKNGLKVAVFGLEGSDVTFTVPAGDRDSVKALDPIQVAKTLVPKLRKQADVVVCLAHTSYFPAQKIAQEAPGIDVVVVGHAPGQGDVPPATSGPIYARSGQRGQNIAKTTVDVENGHITNLASQVVSLGGAIRLSETMAVTVKKFEDALNAETQAQQQKEAAAAPAGATPVGADKYLGAATCERCHQSIYNQWKETRHAHAMQTLVNVQQDANPACVVCHVVGFKEPTGFVSHAVSPALENVQCEVCHGMATKHAEYATVTEVTCKRCHIPERDPEFAFEKRWAQIKH